MGLPFILFSILLVSANEENNDENTRLSRKCQDTYERSIVENSTVVKSAIYLSRIHSVETAKSNILYSIVENSYIGTSILNATYQNADLERGDPDEIFCQSDYYCFNRVYDSLILSSEIGYLHDCKWHPYNSTILKSNINLSGLQNTMVTTSKFCDSLACSSTVCDSEITNRTKILNSAVTGTDTSASGISYSQTKCSTIVQSCVSDTLVLTSNLTVVTTLHCRLEDVTSCYSNLTNSCIKAAEIVTSKVKASEITLCNKISNSAICDSSISKNSNIMDSEILNSTVTNSTLCDVVVVNSSVSGQFLRSVKIINNTLCS